MSGKVKDSESPNLPFPIHMHSVGTRALLLVQSCVLLLDVQSLVSLKLADELHAKQHNIFGGEARWNIVREVVR